ncbi:hypothetical protein ACJX0J_035092, partial [Zea mays]
DEQINFDNNEKNNNISAALWNEEEIHNGLWTLAHYFLYVHNKEHKGIAKELELGITTFMIVPSISAIPPLSFDLIYLLFIIPFGANVFSAFEVHLLWDQKLILSLFSWTYVQIVAFFDDVYRSVSMFYTNFLNYMVIYASKGSSEF